MTVAAVVVAGGRGVRFGGPKQFSLLAGESVAAHSVRASRSVAHYVVLVVPEGFTATDEGADVVVSGGETRADSVRAGLKALPDCDVVVVHDAARPLASPRLFAAVVEAIAKGADAAIPGLSVTDTVKRVVRRNGQSVVTGTLDRSELVTVQTPQAFRRSVLERAHAALDDATDDAALVEAIGGTVVVVVGDSQNVKITEPADLERVARTLESSS
ncbi:MAG: 2-C-methyl-D-erythritol 4-phosphate cytidylyltransferase [Acidobacteria bacterium]|nr:2-C-methyl-D-erythritol 4-phosphate cytidylyltransferase [Acidobacteriota bacterium]